MEQEVQVMAQRYSSVVTVAAQKPEEAFKEALMDGLHFRASRSNRRWFAVYMAITRVPNASALSTIVGKINLHGEHGSLRIPKNETGGLLILSACQVLLAPLHATVRRRDKYRTSTS